MSETAYKRYLLGVLTTLGAFNYVDRLALGLVLQEIKLDLNLTDTQLGFLTGIAFALFYSIMGIPIARWADRGNRVTIISVTAALWSIAVALCGLAGTFVQLLLFRVGVAVGEAGCAPPALSLIADHFSRIDRPRATAIYSAGGPLSALLGYFLAGWLNEVYGWRMMFALLGAPGLGLAILARFTLLEPRRLARVPASDTVPRSTQASVDIPSLTKVVTTLWANATFRHLLMCLSVMYFFLYGILQWLPSFLIRSYGLSTGEIGSWLAVVLGATGVVGVYLGGEFASRHAANNEGRQLRVLAATISAAGALSTLTYFSHGKYLTLGLVALTNIAQISVSGPLFATIQTLVPERMRAVSFAIIYLFANLIGMGFGPLVVGALSDLFRQWAGQESLRYALVALTPGYFWAAWHFWRASQTVARDIAIAQDDFQRGTHSIPAIASIV